MGIGLLESHPVSPQEASMDNIQVLKRSSKAQQMMPTTQMNGFDAAGRIPAAISHGKTQFMN